MRAYSRQNMSSLSLYTDGQWIGYLQTESTPSAEFKGSRASCTVCQFDSVHYGLGGGNNKHNISMIIQCCDLFGSSGDAIFIFNHAHDVSWKGQCSLHWLHFGHFLSWVLCQVKTLFHGYEKSGSTTTVRKPST